MRIVPVSKDGGKQGMAFPCFAVAYSLGYWWGNGILKPLLYLLEAAPNTFKHGFEGVQYHTYRRELNREKRALF